MADSTIESMTDAQLYEYADKLRVINHCHGNRLEMEEWRACQEIDRRKRAARPDPERGAKEERQ